MKTTFDLPDPLLRRAKAIAAEQGRPLRDLVAEAIGEKVAHASEITDRPWESEERRRAFERWKSRLVLQADGTYLNPDGIEDEAFFEALERIRREPWPERDPFEGGR
jgi:hypothetical protein